MTPRQREAIEKHGAALLAIFPDAIERNPVELCKRLRRIESKAHQHAERLCNEDVPEHIDQREAEKIRARLRELLGVGSARIWLNRDPRGYALKLNLEPGERLHTDWGGYGIVAPEIGPEGE